MYGRRQQQLKNYSQRISTREQRISTREQRISTREHLRRGSRSISSYNDLNVHTGIFEESSFDPVGRKTRISTRDQKPPLSDSEDRTADSDEISRNISKRNDEEISEGHVDEQDIDSSSQPLQSSSDHELDDVLSEKSSISKNARLISNFNAKRRAENESDFTVTDPDDSDDIMNYRKSSIGETRRNENRDVIIGGKGSFIQSTIFN